MEQKHCFGSLVFVLMGYLSYSGISKVFEKYYKYCWTNTTENMLIQAHSKPKILLQTITVLNSLYR